MRNLLAGLLLLLCSASAWAASPIDLDWSTRNHWTGHFDAVRSTPSLAMVFVPYNGALYSLNLGTHSFACNGKMDINDIFLVHESSVECKEPFYFNRPSSDKDSQLFINPISSADGTFLVNYVNAKGGEIFVGPAYGSSIEPHYIYFKNSDGAISETSVLNSWKRSFVGTFSEIFYTEGNIGFGTKAPFSLMCVMGGDMVLYDDDISGSEVVNNGALTSGTNWTAALNMLLSNDKAYYTGSYGTLTQTSANFDTAIVPNAIYKLTFDASGIVGNVWVAVGSALATESTYHDMIDGTNTIYFKAKSSPGNLILTVVSGTNATIDDISLKQMLGGDLDIGGKIKCGGDYGLDISSSGSVSCDKDLTIGATLYYNNSFCYGHAHETDVSIVNSSTTFNIIDAAWDTDITCVGFTISGASATYNGEGGSPKIFQITGVFDIHTSQGGTDAYVKLFKNGSGIEHSTIHIHLANAAQTQNCALNILTELEAGYILDVRCSGTPNATLTIDECTFSVTQQN